MKQINRKVAFPLCLLLIALPLTAEISVGVNGGYAYTIDDLQEFKDMDYTITQTEFPFSGEAGWRFDFETNLALVREIAIITGVRAGQTDLESISPSDEATEYVKITLKTIPLLAFCRLETGYVYTDLGLGIHFWDIEYKTDSSDLGNTGTDFAFSFSAGGRLSLFDHLVIRAGPIVNYYSIPEFNNGMGASSATIGVTAGASVEF